MSDTLDRHKRIPMLPPMRPQMRVSILAETVDYNHRLMNIPAMWRNTHGEGVKVVVLDTGLPCHVDLDPCGGKNFTGDDYLIDENGHGCVAPDTLVHTSLGGVERIEDLYSRIDAPEVPWVYPDGTTSTVKDIRGAGVKTLSFDMDAGTTVVGDIEYVHKTHISGDVVSIDVKGGGALALTPWHPVPVQYRDKHGSRCYKKVRADNLSTSDLLIIPNTDKWISDRVFAFEGTPQHVCSTCGHSCVQKRRYCAHSEHRCSRCGARGVTTTETYAYTITEDLAYLIGLIFTDGCMHTGESGTEVTVASKDRELIVAASEISEAAGFGEGTRTLRNGTLWIWSNTKKEFFTFLVNAGLGVGKEKCNALPSFTGHATRGIACAFVAGLIDGDGCIAPRAGTPSNILVTSKTVAHVLRVLLNSLGMRTTIGVAIGTTFGSVNKTRTGRDQFVCRFTAIVPEVIAHMRHPVRRSRALALKPAYRRSVCSIGAVKRTTYSGYFYDFTVTGAHTYLANGIFTSNTHVGGIIAAISANSMGVAGIAPACADYYGAVLGGDGTGTSDGIVRGIRWAVDEIGAHIINMSLGMSANVPHSPELEAACNYATSQGVAVIVAAGNDGAGVGQPACYDSTIAVAAVDARKRKAPFSNYGKEVDFAAGGVDVFSTYLNNTYATLSGTSMACPALTGAAALILSDALRGDNPRRLSPEELKDKLRKIAYDIGPEGVDFATGHGIPVFGRGPSEESVFVPIRMSLWRRILRLLYRG